MRHTPGQIGLSERSAFAVLWHNTGTKARNMGVTQVVAAGIVEYIKPFFQTGRDDIVRFGIETLAQCTRRNNSVSGQQSSV